MTNIDNDKDERRGFFRIDDEVYLEYEVVSEDEYSNAKQKLDEVNESTFELRANFATLNHDNNYLLNNIRRNSPEISQYLDLLNQKIDGLSQHLLESNTSSSEDNLVTVNVSASGIAFNTNENLDKNQAMKLRII